MATAAAQVTPFRAPTPRPKSSRNSSQQSEPTAASKSRPTHAPALPDNGTSTQQTAAGGGVGRGGGGGGGGGAAARRGNRPVFADPLADTATAYLIRRVLCPQHQQSDKSKSHYSSASIEGLLPPLTSRNDVDLQLYALIAIILREYVQNWYAKITPDETFVAEIVQVIAHITRALEQRLRKVDLESLLFDELPELLDRHVAAYRAAHDPIAQPPVKTDPHEIYHSLHPLPALSPVPRPDDPESVAAQAENETAYRQLLVHAVLAILLPTEDLENGCLTTLVGQILSELIIGNAVANRLSEPWLIWELFIILSKTISRQTSPKAEEEPRGKPDSTSPAGRKGFSAQALFWTAVQWCFLAVSFIRVAFAILMVSGSLPPRTSGGTGNHNETLGEVEKASSPSERDTQPSKTPLLAFRCWSAISNLIEMDMRMPWLSGALSMLQWVALTGPGQIARVDGKLDRLLSHGVHRYVLDADNLPPLLRSVRAALFPNNMPAGQPTLVPPSSDAELRALKRRCAASLWALVPKRLGRLYFGGAGASLGPGRGRGRLRAKAGTTGSRRAREGQGAKEATQDAASDGGRRGRERLDDADESVRLRHGGNENDNGDDHDDDDDDDDDDDHDDDDEILDEIERGILDVFGDAYCNKHLVYAALELILVRLLPELAEKGVSELWAERVVI